MTKQVNELSFERARALLGQKEINEDKLKEMLESIKAFCKVSYQLYLKDTHADFKDTDTKEFDAEPTDQFTTAT